MPVYLAKFYTVNSIYAGCKRPPFKTYIKGSRPLIAQRTPRELDVNTSDDEILHAFFVGDAIVDAVKDLVKSYYPDAQFVSVEDVSDKIVSLGLNYPNFKGDSVWKV